MTVPRAHGSQLREHVRANLRRFEPRPAIEGDLRPAAVAAALLPGPGGEPTFVLTRRARGLSRHGGQFALPGGRVDAGEDSPSAALRELEEEVGLSGEGAEVLGVLDVYETRSGFAITPVVVWFEAPRRLRPNPDEVAWAELVALFDLLREDAPYLHRIPESDRPVIGMPLAGTIVHAPTAAILYQLGQVCLLGRDTRVHHFDQPVFAWR